MGLARISAEDVIAEYVLEDYISHHYDGLKRQGSLYSMRCPLPGHEEKTASFKVNPRGQFFKCFGCGQGGNIINFVSKVEKISWHEALRKLAEEAGLAVYTSKKEETDYQRAKAVIQTAVDYYHSHFNLAEEYICGTRKIKTAFVNTFKIGFAPKTEYRNGLLNFLLKKGYTLEEMRRQQLILPKKYAHTEPTDPRNYFDLFDGRVMFPIKGKYGHYVGFGSRVDPDEEREILARGEKVKMKYLNSKGEKTPFGWPMFNKKNLVYGLAEGAHLARELGYLVEGYTDVISMQQQGVFAIAGLGTSFTSGQARLIKRYIDYLINLQDPDEAGLKSLRMAMPIQLKANILPLAKFLPNGEDPDDFFRNRANAAQELENIPLISPVKALVLSHVKQANYDFASADFFERKKMFNKVFSDYVQLLPERSTQFMLLHELANELHVPVSLVHAAFEDQLTLDMKFAANKKIDMRSSGPQHDLTTQIICNLMITNPDNALSKIKEIPLSTPPFKPYQLTIIDKLREHYSENTDGFFAQSTLFDNTAPETSMNGLAWLEELYERGEIPQRAKQEINMLKKPFSYGLDDLVDILHLEHTRAKIDKKNGELIRAMANGDAVAARQAMNEIDELSDDLDWT